MNRFWSETAKRLSPYVPGEQPKDAKYIKLNTNENPYPPAPGVKKILQDFSIDSIRLYPDPVSLELRETIAAYYKVDKACVFVGNGSDEVLAFIFQAFFGGSDLLAFPDITYSFYPVYAKLFGIKYREIPLTEDMTIDFGLYPETLKGIIVANPNAPTGIELPAADLVRLASNKPDTLVVVDEAYADYGRESVVSKTSTLDNLLVVRTMSKSRAFAGLRVGYAIGHRELIEAMVRVKDSFNSYPLDVVAQKAAIESFRDEDYFAAMRELVVNTRNSFTKKLKQNGIKVLDSGANFVFVSLPGISGADVLQLLRKQGILIRHFPAERLLNWLRISIGTDYEMERVADILVTIRGTCNVEAL